MEAKIIIVLGGIIVDNLCGISMFGFKWRQTETSARLAALLHNIYRSLLTTQAAVFIRCNYPNHIFGTLMGFSRIIMGLASMVNMGLVKVFTVHGVDGYMYIILSLALIQCLTLSFPLYSLYMKLKK